MGVHITYMYVLTVEHYLQGFRVSFRDQVKIPGTLVMRRMSCHISHLTSGYLMK